MIHSLLVSSYANHFLTVIPTLGRRRSKLHYYTHTHTHTNRLLRLLQERRTVVRRRRTYGRLRGFFFPFALVLSGGNVLTFAAGHFQCSVRNRLRAWIIISYYGIILCPLVVTCRSRLPESHEGTRRWTFWPTRNFHNCLLRCAVLEFKYKRARVLVYCRLHLLPTPFIREFSLFCISLVTWTIWKRRKKIESGWQTDGRGNNSGSGTSYHAPWRQSMR